MWSRDFKEFVELLNASRVEYLIVGAHAVGLHGRPRYTGDLDIWVRPSPENASRVIAALEKFGFGSVGLRAADFEREHRVVELGYPPYRIDLITSATGVQFDECWPNRVTVEYEGVQAAFIGRDDLIRNKEATGRAKDLGDADELKPK